MGCGISSDPALRLFHDLVCILQYGFPLAIQSQGMLNFKVTGPFDVVPHGSNQDSSRPPVKNMQTPSVRRL